MADEIVRDYLGHPCNLAEARRLYGDDVPNFAKVPYRELRRDLGMELLDMHRRHARMHEAQEGLAELSQVKPGSTQALSELMVEAQCDLANRYHSLSTKVMAMLDRLDAREVANG